MLSVVEVLSKLVDPAFSQVASSSDAAFWTSLTNNMAIFNEMNYSKLKNKKKRGKRDKV
jgi:hypothetical protein